MGDHLPDLVVAADNYDVVAERELGDAPGPGEPWPRAQLPKGGLGSARVGLPLLRSRSYSRSYGRSSLKAFSDIHAVRGPCGYVFELGSQVLKAPQVLEHEIRVVFGSPEPDDQAPGRHQDVSEPPDLPVALAGIAQVDGDVLDPKQPRPVPASKPKQGLCELRRGLAALSVDEQRHRPERKHLAAPAPREAFVLRLRR